MYSLSYNLNLSEALLPPVLPSVEYTALNVMIYAFLLAFAVSRAAKKDLAAPTSFSYTAASPYILLAGGYFGLALRSGSGLKGLLAVPVAALISILLWQDIDAVFQRMIVAIGYLWCISLIYVHVPGEVVYDVTAMGLPLLVGAAVLWFFTEEGSKPYILAGFTHALDAVTTSVGLRYGLEETMFPARILVQWFGTPGIFILKAALIPVVLYGAWQLEEEDRSIVLFAVFAID